MRFASEDHVSSRDQKLGFRVARLGRCLCLLDPKLKESRGDFGLPLLPAECHWVVTLGQGEKEDVREVVEAINLLVDLEALSLGDRGISIGETPN